MSIEAPKQPPLLTIPEVAERLRVGRGFVYKLLNTGALEHVKIGVGGRPRRRVSETQLAAYLEEAGQAPAETVTPAE